MLQQRISALRLAPRVRPAALTPFPALQNILKQAWSGTRGTGNGQSLRFLWSEGLAAARSTPLRQRLQGLLSSGSPLRPRALPTARPMNTTVAARRAYRSSRTRRSKNNAPEVPAEQLSLSQRMRKLSREYGWATVGVYFALSVLDFPLCFLLVRLVGTDKIAEIEHWVVSHVSQFIPASVKDLWRQWKSRSADEDDDGVGGGDDLALDSGDKWGVKEAQENHKQEASLATQLALAYAVHKSFIFIRVPLTAAITPKVVKKLRSWGWQIGKRRPKKAKTPKPR